MEVQAHPKRYLSLVQPTLCICTRKAFRTLYVSVSVSVCTYVCVEGIHAMKDQKKKKIKETFYLSLDRGGAFGFRSGSCGGWRTSLFHEVEAAGALAHPR